MFFITMNIISGSENFEGRTHASTKQHVPKVEKTGDGNRKT